MAKVANSDASSHEDVEEFKVRIVRIEEVQKSFNGKLDYVKEDISEIKTDIKDLSIVFNEHQLTTAESRITVKNSLENISTTLGVLKISEKQKAQIQQELRTNRTKLKDKVIYGSFGAGVTTVMGYMAKIVFGF